VHWPDSNVSWCIGRASTQYPDLTDVPAPAVRSAQPPSVTQGRSNCPPLMAARRDFITPRRQHQKLTGKHCKRGVVTTHLAATTAFMRCPERPMAAKEQARNAQRARKEQKNCHIASCVTACVFGEFSRSKVASRRYPIAVQLKASISSNRLCQSASRPK
jgi:hypothetical protein